MINPNSKACKPTSKKIATTPVIKPKASNTAPVCREGTQTRQENKSRDHIPAYKTDVTEPNIVMSALAKVLRGREMSVCELNDGISYKVSLEHPQSPADFGDKAGVITISFVTMVPNKGYGYEDTLELQCEAWSTSSQMVNYYTSLIARVLRSLSPGGLQMKGVQMLKPPIVKRIGGPKEHTSTGLWFAAVPFTVRTTTSHSYQESRRV